MIRQAPGQGMSWFGLLSWWDEGVELPRKRLTGGGRGTPAGGKGGAEEAGKVKRQDKDHMTVYFRNKIK